MAFCTLLCWQYLPCNLHGFDAPHERCAVEVSDAVDKIGKGLFATRTINPGEIITEEEPLLCVTRDSFEADIKCVLEAFFRASLPVQTRFLSLFSGPSDDSCLHGIATSEQISLFASSLSVDNDLIKKVFGVWKFNATAYKGSLLGVFHTHARVNHSCKPNAVFEGGVLRCITQRKRGDEVNISYLPRDLLLASSACRQRRLRENYLFTCQCVRCVQEFDYARLWKCPKCENGIAVFRTTFTSRDSKDGVLCLKCKHSFPSTSFDTAVETQIEDTIADYLALISVVSAASKEELTTHISALQTRLSDTTGDCHWTHFALMLLRYYYKSPIDISVHVQWLNAVVRYCRLIVPDMQWLADRMLFRIGVDLSKCSNPLFRLMASRYYQLCIESMTFRYGMQDPAIQNMSHTLDSLRTRKKRTDIVLCGDPFCPNDVEDSALLPASVLVACPHCLLVSYCNEECQRNHAESHTFVCRCCISLHALGLSLPT